MVSPLELCVLGSPLELCVLGSPLELRGVGSLVVLAHLCPSAEAIGCRRCTSHSPSPVQPRCGVAGVEGDEVTPNSLYSTHPWTCFLMPCSLTGWSSGWKSDFSPCRKTSPEAGCSVRTQSVAFFLPLLLPLSLPLPYPPLFCSLSPGSSGYSCTEGHWQSFS